MSSNNEAIVIPHINSLSLSKDILHYIYSNYRAIKVKILYLYKALVRKIYFSLLLFFITILFAIIICCHKFDGDFIRMKLFKCVKFYFLNKICYIAANTFAVYCKSICTLNFLSLIHSILLEFMLKSLSFNMKLICSP